MDFKKKYNLTLTDIDTHRNEKEVQCRVMEMMKQENLEFTSDTHINSPEQETRILEIWHQVIRERKDYL